MRRWFVICCVLALLAACGEEAAPTAAPPTDTPPTATAASTPTATASAELPEDQVPGVVGGIKFLGVDGRTLYAFDAATRTAEPWLELDIAADAPLESLVADQQGQYLAVTAGTGDVTIYDAAGMLVASQSGLGPVRWSPSGARWMAPVKNIDPATPRFIIYETAGAQSVVAEIEASSVDWSGSDSTVVAVRGTSIDVIDIDSRSESVAAALPDDWFVLRALIENNTLLFYGSRSEITGGAVNGLQWWQIPLPQPCGDACPEPVAFTEPRGFGVDEVAMGGALLELAYVETTRTNACSAFDTLAVQSLLGPEGVREAPLPAAPAEGGAVIKGMQWVPLSTALVFGLESYSCSGDGLAFAPGIVYSWDLSDPGALSEIGTGSWPIWMSAAR